MYIQHLSNKGGTVRNHSHRHWSIINQFFCTTTNPILLHFPLAMLSNNNELGMQITAFLGDDFSHRERICWTHNDVKLKRDLGLHQLLGKSMLYELLCILELHELSVVVGWDVNACPDVDHFGFRDDVQEVEYISSAVQIFNCPNDGELGVLWEWGETIDLGQCWLQLHAYAVQKIHVTRTGESSTGNTTCLAAEIPSLRSTCRICCC